GQHQASGSHARPALGSQRAGDAAHRCPGPGSRAPVAARDGRGAGLEHSRLHQRLPRLPPRRLRQGVGQAGEAPGRGERRLRAGPERRPRRHRRLGQPADRLAGPGQAGWRVRHLVRQGPRRGPQRRRAAPRQQRRHRPARRRARARRRRPLGQVLHRHQRLRIRLRRSRNPDARPGRGGGGARLRPEGAGDVALRRPLGRHEVRGRDHGRRRHPPPRPGCLRHARPGRFPPAPGRRPHPPRRHGPLAGSPAQGGEAPRRRGLRPRQRRGRDGAGQPRRALRHRRPRQGLRHPPTGHARRRHLRRDGALPRPAPLEGGPRLAPRRRGGLRLRPRAGGGAGGRGPPRPPRTATARRPLPFVRKAPRRRQEGRARPPAALGADGAGRRAGAPRPRRPAARGVPHGADARPFVRTGRARRRHRGALARPRAVLLPRLPPQQFHQGAGGQPSLGRHRLPLPRPLHGPPNRGLHPDGRRRHALARHDALHRGRARIRQHGRRHLHPLRQPCRARRRRRQGDHDLQDPGQRRRGHDRRPNAGRRNGRAADRGPDGGRGRGRHCLGVRRPGPAPRRRADAEDHRLPPPLRDGRGAAQAA
ncbi:MAG: Indolepyruvate ferredoxin oxidoreductase, alpha and beta subunits, partial [uncultured Acetobacteraceae bacterium]